MKQLRRLSCGNPVSVETSPGTANAVSNKIEITIGGYRCGVAPRDLLPFALILILIIVKPILRILPDTVYSLLVYPTQAVVSIFSGIDFTPLATSSYRNFATGIVIDRSCAGMTFLLISWVVCCIAVRRIPVTYQLTLLPLLLLAGFIVTLLANISRIVCSIFAVKMAMVLFPGFPVHTAIGITVYLTYLLSFYITVSWYLNTRKFADEDLS